MSVLESVMQKLGEKKAAIAADFASLVAAIADGTEPTADKVADVLDASEKTVGDLEAAVTLLQKRRALRAAYDAAQPAKQRVAEIDSQLQKIETKREAFDKKCDDERWPLDGEREQLQATIAAAGNAQRELYATSTNPAIAARSGEIAQELELIERQIRKHQDDRERFSAMAIDAHRTATSISETDGRRVFANKDAETYGGYCASLDTQIAAMRDDRAKLLAERDQLDARRLEP